MIRQRAQPIMLIGTKCTKNKVIVYASPRSNRRILLIIINFSFLILFCLARILYIYGSWIYIFSHFTIRKIYSKNGKKEKNEDVAYCKQRSKGIFKFRIRHSHLFISVKSILQINFHTYGYGNICNIHSESLKSINSNNNVKFLILKSYDKV